MDLLINDTRQSLLPIRQFRAEYHLPDTFSVALFEPKDETGLARVDGAGDAFISLRDAILQALPPLLTTLPSVDFLEHLIRLFSTALYAVNSHIGLKPVEIDYAVSGFGDVLMVWFYDQIRASQTKTAPTPFDTLYDSWLADSGRCSQRPHTYTHNGQSWTIFVLNNAYGRVGLQVNMTNRIVYLQDTIYLCPAEGFMRALLRDVVTKLTTRPGI